MVAGFKEFVMRGNVIDLAVAVVMGTAVTALVTSFTDAVINPLLAAVGGSDSLGFGFTIVSGNDATFVNIGAVIGILPITGVPLPFVSAGGSSLVFGMAGAGLLLSVARQATVRSLPPHPPGLRSGGASRAARSGGKPARRERSAR